MIIQIEPFINSEELEQLKRVVDSTFVTEHSLNKVFETFFRKYTGVKHCISYCNGTAALFAILKSLGIGPGDEVIVPDMTFIATANSVILAGAKPVFCDIEPVNLGIDVKKAEKLITKRTKAIIPVHLYGFAAKLNELVDFSNNHNIHLIEDAAQGVGVEYDRKHVGTLGIAGILSFYGNKTITTGEGGLILTNDDDIAEQCYRLKNHGRDKKGVFIHEHIGYNFSFTEMQAAIGIAQCNKLERILAKKKSIYMKYSSELKSINQIIFKEIPNNISPVFWFTNIYVLNADDLREYLFQNGIGTRRFFYPLHRQPCYNDFNCEDKDYSITNQLYETGLSLPSSYNLSRADQEIIIDKIKTYFKEEKE